VKRLVVCHHVALLCLATALGDVVDKVNDGATGFTPAFKTHNGVSCGFDMSASVLSLDPHSSDFVFTETHTDTAHKPRFLVRTRHVELEVECLTR